MLTLELPWVLLLLPLPWLVMRFMPPATQQESALTIPFYDRLPINESTKQNTSPAKHRLFIMLACWLLLLLACARPHWIGDTVQLPSTGRNLMLAVDISGSMQVEDMELNNRRANRLQVVKAVVGEFVQQRVGDRLGLILFGSQAYLQTPLTFDRNTLHQLLIEAQIGFAGEKTAIGDAIGLAIKRLKDNDNGSRVLILLTDGANTEGEVPPKQAALLAKQANIKIYTIGMGAEEMISGGIFGTQFGARRQNPSADLDEETLQLIANETGGKYFRAKDTQQLANIYAELDELEAIEQDSASYRPRKSLFYYPLGLALLLMGLWALTSLLSAVIPSALQRRFQGSKISQAFKPKTTERKSP